MALTIHADSHIDHGLTKAQVAWLLARHADKVAFFIETVRLPADLGTAPCGIHGPVMGNEPVPESEVHYAVRGGRPNESRMCNRPVQQTSFVTVIAGPHDDQPCILFTAYGGPCAPREPGDPNLPEEEREASVAFWAEHALSAE